MHSNFIVLSSIGDKWETLYTQDGRPYYYNTSKKLCSWDVPTVGQLGTTTPIETENKNTEEASPRSNEDKTEIKNLNASRKLSIRIGISLTTSAELTAVPQKSLQCEEEDEYPDEQRLLSRAEEEQKDQSILEDRLRLNQGPEKRFGSIMSNKLNAIRRGSGKAYTFDGTNFSSLDNLEKKLRQVKEKEQQLHQEDGKQQRESLRLEPKTEGDGDQFLKSQHTASTLEVSSQRRMSPPPPARSPPPPPPSRARTGTGTSPASAQTGTLVEFSTWVK